MADDKTAAERAAEVYPFAREFMKREGFVAGAAWQAEQARPVLTREQGEALAAMWVTEFKNPRPWPRDWDSGANRPVIEAVLAWYLDALLAQGDVPAQTLINPYGMNRSPAGHMRNRCKRCARAAS